jgi:hypothetical protein
MDDPCDLVLVEHPLERSLVGDVALDDPNPVGVVAQHEVESVARLAGIEADDLDLLVQ